MPAASTRSVFKPESRFYAPDFKSPRTNQASARNTGPEHRSRWIWNTPLQGAGLATQGAINTQESRGVMRGGGAARAATDRTSIDGDQKRTSASTLPGMPIHRAIEAPPSIPFHRHTTLRSATHLKVWRTVNGMDV